MKKFLATLFFLLAANLCVAASNDILKSLGAIKTLTADFTQTNTYADTADTEGKPVQDTFSGNVSVIMKNKAIFEYTEPYVSWYLFQKGSLETYDSVTNQLIKYKDGTLGDNIFLEVLTDFSAIETSFDVKETSPLVLHLTPQKNIGVKYLVVTVDEKNKISSMKTEDVMGNITELKFKNVKTDIKIPAKTFDKKLPEGVTIIEQ